MWRRVVTGLGLVTMMVAAAPAAQAQDQSFSVSLGYFTARGQDSRNAGDVMNANRCIDVTFACEPLLFEVSDFNDFTINGEWLVGVGDFFEVGAGIGYYQGTVPSIYEFVTNEDGSEIEQDLKLRVVPISATVRFIPTGRNAALQPYIGAGIAAFRWRYSETGEFVDTLDYSVFRATYEADGTEVGPIVMAGLKAPVSDNVLIGGEVRWQRADGDLPDDTDEFLGDKIDLGGISYSATLQFRF
jgi:opacity protein-like surface antigen